MNTSVICEFGGHLDSDETNPRGVLRSSPGPTRLFPVGRDAPEQCVFLSLLFCWKLCSSGENNAHFRGCISQRVGKAGCGRQTPDGAATGERRRGKEGKVRAKPSPLWALSRQGNWLLPTPTRGWPLCGRTVLSRAPPAGPAPLTLSR